MVSEKVSFDAHHNSSELKVVLALVENASFHLTMALSLSSASVAYPGGGAQGARAPPSALTKYSILCANTLMAQPQHLPDYFQS